MSNSKDVAVSIRGIRKEFILPQNKNTTFKQTVVNIVKKNNKITQKTLDDVSFDIHKGDFFGIIGRNGSGKSTLLKLIAGVYTPTAGSITVNGGLTPFIELGVGFNPELSGRDNVYLNGALLGFTRQQMSEMYDEIVDFAELGPFMDQRLKNYSSGMQVRLAFSIAIKAKNDILIFDEVLAVGDEAFQRKCLDVFDGYKASGQTVILVTHDMETVKQYCTRAALINNGKLVEVGSPRGIANKYSKLNQEEIEKSDQKQAHKVTSLGIKSFIYGENNSHKQTFYVGEKARVNVSWSGAQKLESIGVNIFKESGEHIAGFNTRYSDIYNDLDTESLNLSLGLNISAGRYHLVIEAFSEDGKVVDALLDGPKFTVVNEDKQEWSGLFNLPHQWN